MKRVFVINPGSFSTKVAYYTGTTEVLNINIIHDQKELSRFDSTSDQEEFRKAAIDQVLRDHRIEKQSFDAIAARGGLLAPIEGGVYRVGARMLEDLKEAKRGDHPCNLGAIIADHMARENGVEAFIVDPVVIDEMDDIARLSGMPEIDRVSIFHALNQKATARKAALELNKKYEEANLIVVHMGSGISAGAHRRGRVSDINNALAGDGPFSPERSGGLPVGPLVGLCFSGKYTQKEIMQKIKGSGGMKAYLGTPDAREVEQRIAAGDEKALLVYRSMAYQVAKEIGGLAAALSGEVDGIVLTGGLAKGASFIGMIRERVSFLAPVFVYPGECEMEALRDGVLRVLAGEEEAKEYR